jgi:hypothetical protein
MLCITYIFLDILNEPNIEEHVLKIVDLPEILNKIKRLITLHKFKLASKFLLHGRATFKDEPLFMYVLSVYLKSVILHIILF